MPEPRDHLGVAALGGQIYVYAGRLPDGTTRSRLDRHEPATDTWTRLADGPVGTSGIELRWRATASSTPPVARCRCAAEVLGSAWVYGVASDRWEETTPLPGRGTATRACSAAIGST